MSQAAAKDLNYYLSHTDEMPTDPKEIERLANEHMEAALEAGTEQLNVDTIVGTADEIPGDAAANAESKEPKKDEPAPAKAEAEPAAAQAAAAAKPDGVLAKDGKNVIPYSQLESARQRAAEAEALVRQQAEELAQLRRAQAPTGTQEPAQDAEMLTDEELDALAEDSPTLAKTLRSQQAAIRQLRETVEGVTRTQATQQAAQVAEVKTEVQSAIDGNATLAEWQTAQDRTMWTRASSIDRMLRELPEYANVSFADRFDKVVEMTQIALGQQPDAPAPAQQKEELTPEQIKTAAKAKLTAAAKGRRPTTLSDIPGGAPPAVDERQKVEEMSTVGLGQMFLGMTPEQRDAYLQSL